jgi:nucleotide-binding universal stress UspA family protein
VLNWGILTSESILDVGRGFLILKKEAERKISMKKILVPTDLSPLAELGLKLATEIAQKTNSTIALVNFMKHPISTTFTAMGDITTKVDEEEEVFAIKVIQKNEERLRELSDKYSSKAKIDFSIVDDELETGLDDFVVKEEIDLVVMGTSGEENASEIFTGNHTEKVIEISSCPVLSVRDGFSIADFKHIVIAVTMLDDEKITRSLRYVHDLAKAFDSVVHLVHVIDPANDVNRDLNNYFSNLAVNTLLVPYTVDLLQGHDQPELVMKFAKETRAGLIAVVKQSNSGFRIFSNHFSDRLVKEEGRPVFTLNANKI